VSEVQSDAIKVSADHLPEVVGEVSRGALSLGRCRRLRRAREIQSLFERGNRRTTETFVALWRRRTGSRRVGFAVGRRVGGAVDRNRVRRRLREAYRRSQHIHPDAIEIMFVGRVPAVNASFDTLLAEMRRLLEALGETDSPSRAKVR